MKRLRYKTEEFIKIFASFAENNPNGSRSELCRAWKISKTEFIHHWNKSNLVWHNDFMEAGYTKGTPSSKKPKDDGPVPLVLEQPKPQTANDILNGNDENEKPTLLILTHDKIRVNEIVSRFMKGE